MKMTRLPFRKSESYKHKEAINVFCDWIKEEPELLGYHFKVRYDKDVEFYMNGKISFVPDIVIYDNNEYDDILVCVEVEHTNPVSINKLNRVVEYQYKYSEYFPIIEIDAEWIMRQTEIPRALKYKNMYPDIRCLQKNNEFSCISKK